MRHSLAPRAHILHWANAQLFCAPCTQNKRGQCKALFGAMCVPFKLGQCNAGNWARVKEETFKMRGGRKCEKHQQETQIAGLGNGPKTHWR